MKHSSLSTPLSSGPPYLPPSQVTVLKISVSISAIHCRCTQMTSSFSGLLGVYIHTHTHSFPSELGKISVDTISEIRIFAFKGINLAQGPTLGISLVLLFHSFLKSFKVENYMTTCRQQLLSWCPMISASQCSCPCVISFLHGEGLRPANTM